MLLNHLKVAFRNFWRNKTFSFLNMAGLAIGMACSLLILLWVLDEKSVDAFHANKDRLYSIYERMYFDEKIEAAHSTPGPMADELKKVFPEVQYACSFSFSETGTFAVGDKILQQQGNHAGADFFKMFSYPLIAGNANTALATPESIALSRKMAEIFFGSPQAAIGKTIRYENQIDFKVNAVFENLPQNTSEKFDFIASWQSFLDHNTWAEAWNNNGPLTYILLRPDANAIAFEKKITHFLDGYNKDQNATFKIELGIQRFSDIYLHSHFENGQLSGGRIEYVRLFSLVAVFILLIACINFMNLTTARSVKRAKEIGVRKVVGAARSVLVRQFMGEAILLSFFSLFFAVLLTFLLLPGFNHFTGKAIILPVNKASFWAMLFCLMLITGIISGSYPALFLSAFKPITVLKGTLKFGTGAAWFRKGLVVFQFVLSVLLIIATIVVSKQINYVQSKNLGYDRENLLYIPLSDDLVPKYSLFKEEALKLAGVQAVTRITHLPTLIENGTLGIDWEGKDPNAKPMFTWAFVGYDFVKTMKLKLAAGRDFSKNFATDSIGYLINESAMSRIGYKDPIGKRLTFWGKNGTIVGVLKDFHFNSLHKPIEPLILTLGESAEWGNILVRVRGDKTKEALTGLQKLCKQLNPAFPFSYQFSDEEYQKLYKSEQVVRTLSNYFAFLAVFISCLGLIGLSIFTAEQRMKEISIRKVLGASVQSLFTLLSKDFLWLVVLALVIATPLAWWAMSNWLRDFAYHINIKWWMFAAAGCVAIAIALLTVSFQAIKAATANPVKNLRTE